jgi:hypothetical protein
MASSIFIYGGGFSTSGSAFGWPLGTTLTENSQSNLTLGPGATQLPVLNFGGTTSAFPALRRQGNVIEVILADASAYAAIATNTIGLKTTAGAATGFVLANSDGVFLIENSTATSGAVLDVITADAQVRVRNRANSAYGTVDCLGLKASGAAGANFGPAAVASLTVVNGIVTAVS